MVSRLIIYLILDGMAPQEQPPYVPKKRRRRKSHLSITLLDALNQCAMTLTERINNMKVQRRHHPPRLRYSGHRPKRKKGKCVLNTTVTGMTTTWSNDQTAPSSTFDSDLQVLMLDDGALACITNDKRDFIEPPKRVDRKVKGIKGHANATHQGTLKWHIEDDHSLVHVMVINGAYLIPDAVTRILSPQHLAQEANDHYPMAEGTGALMTSKNITLFWAQRRLTKTVPLDSKTNMGLTTTASGARSFRAFCATITIPETKQMNIFTTHVIPDEEDDESFQPKDPIEPASQEDIEQAQTTDKVMTEGLKTSIVDMGPVTHVIPDDQVPTSLDPHDELLRWHYRLGHLPFDCIRQLALKGQLPKHLLSCKKPFCSACQYGKMTKRPWRVKGDDKKATKMATRPGQIVLVDQLESNTPGLIAQLKGKLTQQRYKYATVFVDQFSGYTFVYLQKHLTSEETVMAKHAFKSSVDQQGVKILHYHADNGHFADNAFISNCKAQRQGLSCCGVNAHFQNGIAERRIRDLQEQTRTSMLYAINKWKQMILICLWPYAMWHANDVANTTPRKGEDQSPLERFSGVNVMPKLRHFHAFGCPTYVLDNALQSDQGSPKWKQCARLGVYLGPSPSHAWSVALVLNPRTGHVSPQFHVKFDDFFETVWDKPNDLDAPEPEWKYISGFAVNKGHSEPAGRGLTNRLLAPRRGPITAVTNSSLPQERMVPPPEPQEEPPIPDSNGAAADIPEDLLPEHHPAPPLPCPQPAQTIPAARQTRSGRVIHNTPCYEQSVSQRNQGLVAWEVLLDQDDREDVPTSKSQYAIQKAMGNPMAFAAMDNPDILYWDQAMRAHDWDKFIEAVQIELDGHEKMGNYEPIPLNEVLKGTKLLDMVWSMWRKRMIKTQEVYKWKAQLNVHGGQQVHGVHYWDTYTPVVTWQTVRLFLILSLILGWQSHQLNFVMAYPQAPAEMPLYMCLPQGTNAKECQGKHMHSSWYATCTGNSKPAVYGINTWTRA